MQCACEMPEELEWYCCNIKKDWEKKRVFCWIVGRRLARRRINHTALSSAAGNRKV